MMMEAWADHWVGNLVILVVFGLGTVACFAVALRMLIHPGEREAHHPKYRILRDDR
ncbi:hypothetical protein [uncultured Castellaniella sp.]|uniref:hypothetical protein n=1 Tax=uncultured Castellaniella sp. TaxID=647907 RepID=UPI002637E38A|nr:hypothetical protein [uncultured Castellaniella sp.]